MPTPRPPTTPNVTRKPAAPKAEAVRPAKASIVPEAVAPRREDPVVNPATLELMVAEAAYYRAEQRGFAPGGELQDWLEAEAQVQARLRK